MNQSKLKREKVASFSTHTFYFIFFFSYIISVAVQSNTQVIYQDFKHISVNLLLSGNLKTHSNMNTFSLFIFLSHSGLKHFPSSCFDVNLVLDFMLRSNIYILYLVNEHSLLLCICVMRLVYIYL